MERYFGFDLGDAESAVARLTKDPADIPEILKIRESQSFITAYAQMPTGEILIGETACYAAKAVQREIRFKSRYLRDPESRFVVRMLSVQSFSAATAAGAAARSEEEADFFPPLQAVSASASVRTRMTAAIFFI